MSNWINLKFVPPIRLLLAAIALGAGGSFHFGYQLSTPNPTVNVFRRFLNESYSAHYGVGLGEDSYRGLWSFVLTLQSIGCILGSLILVPTAEKLGRKKGFLFVSALNAIGIALQIASKRLLSFEALAVGRFIVGIGTGLVLGLQPMYLSEVSPKEYRGAVSGTTAIFLEFGFGLGASLALHDVLGSDELWPYIYVVELCVIVIMWIALIVLPESPKYSVARGRKGDALKALQFYRHAQPSDSMREIEREVRSQAKMATWKEIIEKPHLRRGMLLGFGVFIVSVFSGITALDYFSTFLLIEVGLSPQAAEYATVAILGQTFVATIISSFIVDRIGRRPLLLVTIVLMTASNILFMIFSILYKNFQSPWMGYACIIVCILFTLSFGIGPSVLQWVINAEMMPQNARSPAQSLNYTITRILSILTSVAFFPLQGAVGAYSLLMFIIPLPVMFIIFYLFLPETKRRTTVEIMQSLGYELVEYKPHSAVSESRGISESNSSDASL